MILQRDPSQAGGAVIVLTFSSLVRWGTLVRRSPTSYTQWQYLKTVAIGDIGSATGTIGGSYDTHPLYVGHLGISIL